MGAVENTVIVPVQSQSASDEPRVLCIINNMVSRAEGVKKISMNLPMSVSCQSLIDDIKAKFEYMPTDICVLYERPCDNGEGISVKINDSPDKSIGDICLHCGDKGRNIFYVYELSDSQNENWDTSSQKSRTVRSNAIYEMSEQSRIISQAVVETGCTSKDNYDTCSASASTSTGFSSLSLNTISKSDTGYVGLVNQAMTCYLNSLLQTLFMTPEFRNAVYRWKFDGTESEAFHSIPYQLQRLFLQLQTSSKRAIETTDITRSFGWDSSEAWHQHDVQELCRVMFDALERKWKSTVQENLINELYQGKMKDYVKCLKCGSVRARPDTYLDLPLVIRPYGSDVGYGSVEQALKAFEEPEILEGNNQYFCGKCDQHCDAHKGLKISSFPYILTLHLKRFGFDPCTYQRFKLNDRMTFPEMLQLERIIESDDEELVMAVAGEGSVDSEKKVEGSNSQEDTVEDEGIDIEDSSSNQTLKIASDLETFGAESASNQRQVTYQYELFSIMIHSGSAAGGHYYAYIKSFKDGNWYSFNDQHVYRISDDDIERTFGGNSMTSASYSTYSSSANAYMLQYRLVDPQRNKGFMDEADFQSYLKDELLNIQRKEEEEMQRQELDRNTCKIKLYVYDDFLGRYMEHRFEIHKSKTLKEATEMAWEKLQLIGLSLDCVRLVKFDSTNEYIEQSFEGEEEENICCILGGVKSSYHFDLLLERKQPDEEFPLHFRGGVMIKLHQVDLLGEMIDPEKSIRVRPSDTVVELKLLLSVNFDLCLEAMTLVIQKGFSNFCPLLDPERTLSEEGFEKVNRIFVDCSGVESYEDYFPRTKFFQLLDRFANTIMLTISLPSINEICRLQTSLTPSFYSNINSSPSQNLRSNSLSANESNASTEKPADIDEGIGESETDIHCGASTSGVPSETDLNVTGVDASKETTGYSELQDSPGEVVHSNAESPRCKRDIGNDCDTSREDAGQTNLICDNSTGSETVRSDNLIITDDDLSNLPQGDSLGVVTERMDLSGELAEGDENKLGDSHSVLNETSHKSESMSTDIDDTNAISLGPPNVASDEGNSYSMPFMSKPLNVSTSTACSDDRLGLNYYDERFKSEKCTVDELFSDRERIQRSDSVEALFGAIANGMDRTLLMSQGSGSSQTVELDEFNDIPTPQTSPRVSSPRSNTPSMENEKDIGCEKEIEENWDLDEPDSTNSYFKVVGEINGLFEQTLTVDVDRRITVKNLKTELEPYMGLSEDNFRVFRASPTGPDIEMTRLNDQLIMLVSGSKLSIKLGRALKKGEYKLSVYQLLVHEVEPIKFLLEIIVAEDISLANLKQAISRELGLQLSIDLPVDRCRLRKKSWKNPAGIITCDLTLRELFKDSISIEILLDALEEGPDPMEVDGISMLQLYVRRWWPSKCQCDPVQELIVSDWTLTNVCKEISRLSGIAEENVYVAKARGLFPCNISALEVEKELEWNPSVVDISIFPMSVTDDGAVLYYKDKTEQLAELTKEQMKEVQEKENNRLQKAKPTTKFPSKPERALKIYTVGDPADDRDSFHPV